MAVLVCGTNLRCAFDTSRHASDATHAAATVRQVRGLNCPVAGSAPVPVSVPVLVPVPVPVPPVLYT